MSRTSLGNRGNRVGRSLERQSDHHPPITADHWPMHATHSKITASAFHLPLLNEAVMEDAEGVLILDRTDRGGSKATVINRPVHTFKDYDDSQLSQKTLMEKSPFQDAVESRMHNVLAGSVDGGTATGGRTGGCTGGGTSGKAGGGTSVGANGGSGLGVGGSPGVEGAVEVERVKKKRTRHLCCTIL